MAELLLLARYWCCRRQAERRSRCMRSRIAWVMRVLNERPRPGADGSTVIAAHVDSKTGPDVFCRLRELGVGDTVGGGLSRQSDRVREVSRVQAPALPFRGDLMNWRRIPARLLSPRRPRRRPRGRQTGRGDRSSRLMPGWRRSNSTPPDRRRLRAASLARAGGPTLPQRPPLFSRFPLRGSRRVIPGTRQDGAGS